MLNHILDFLRFIIFGSSTILLFCKIIEVITESPTYTVSTALDLLIMIVITSISLLVAIHFGKKVFNNGDSNSY